MEGQPVDPVFEVDLNTQTSANCINHLSTDKIDYFNLMLSISTWDSQANRCEIGIFNLREREREREEMTVCFSMPYKINCSLIRADGRISCGRCGKKRVCLNKNSGFFFLLSHFLQIFKNPLTLVRSFAIASSLLFLIFFFLKPDLTYLICSQKLRF